MAEGCHSDLVLHIITITPIIIPVCSIPHMEWEATTVEVTTVEATTVEVLMTMDMVMDITPIMADIIPTG